MARSLFHKERGKWIGEFPHDPELGFQSGRRGIRRVLCEIEDIEGLSRDAKIKRLIELYSKKQAELKRQKQESEKQKKLALKEKKKQTVKQASRTWLKDVEVLNSKKTHQDYTKSISLYLQCCGDHVLNDFERSHNVKFYKFLTTIITNRGTVLSSASQNRHMRHLGTFLNWAYDTEIMDRHIKLKSASVPKKDMETYTIEELFILRDHIIKRKENAESSQERLHMTNIFRAFKLATASLLRLGAIWSLRLDHIDIDKKIIRIRDNKELEWVNKKNKWPNKPINDDLLTFITEDIEARSASEVYYLDNGKGKPWYADRGDISKLASALCKECGLPNIKPFHWGMRATMITELLNRGVDPKAVQQLADHDKLETTMLYFNTRTVSQNTAANALPPI